MTITRRGLHEEISRLDTIIETANGQKADQYAAYREQLEESGLVKSKIKSEIDAFKKAERKLRAIKKNPDAAHEQDELVDEIVCELTSAAKQFTRTRATREEPPHPNPSSSTPSRCDSDGEAAASAPPDGAAASTISQSVAATPDSDGEATCVPQSPPDTPNTVVASTFSDDPFNADVRGTFLDRTGELRV